MSDLVIDATNPDNLNKKPLSENETRRRILKTAKMRGCEVEMQRIFDKYDTLLRNCTNQKEASEISQLGVWEIYSLLGKGGQLYINNKKVYDEDDNKGLIIT